MTESSQIDEMSNLIISARRTMAPFDPRASRLSPANLDDVYAIQARVAAATGPVGGFKFGRKTADETPVFAPIFANTIRQSPATFAAEELNLLGIELEIAFLIHAELPPVHADDFTRRARDCIAPLAAIEVVDTRLAAHEEAGPLWKLADNQINAGLVVGKPLMDWQNLDLTSALVSFTAGEATVFRGRGQVPGGNALDGFAAFARAVGAHCGGLRKGQVVTTGSLTGLVFVPKGSTVVGDIEGLGRVELTTPAC